MASGFGKLHPVTKSLAVTLPSIGLLLLIWWHVGAWYHTRLVLDTRNAVETKLTPYGAALAASLNEHVGLLEGVSALVKSHPELTKLEEHFELFAAGLVSGKTGIRAVQVFLHNTPVLMYPTERNAASVGRTLEDLIKDERPNVRADVARAVKTGRITLSGPYELRQGGLGMVARQAIFHQNALVGIATVVLDVPPLLTQAGLDRINGGMELALRNEAGSVFFGPARVFENDPVVYRVILPDGAWSLAAVPKNGWSVAVQQSWFLFQTIGLVMVGLVGCLILVISWYQGHLRITVEQRTSELSQELKMRQRAEEWQRLAAVAANIGLWDWELPTNRVQFSPEWKSQIGYEDHEISNDFEEWRTRVHPGDLERSMATIDACLNGPDGDFKLEFRFRHKDGSYRWILAIASLQYDRNGKPFRLLGCHLDITDRKNAESALRESETQYRLLAETARDFIVTHDLEGRITFANPMVIGTLGYSRDELLTRSVVDMVTPEFVKDMRMRRDLRVAGNSKRYLYELEFVDRSGRRIPVEASSSPIMKNGEMTGILVVARDITERKEAEAALRESEETFRTLFETMIQGVIYQAADGRIVSANSAAERILGLTLDQMQGRTSMDSRWRAIQEDGSDFPGELHPAMEALRTGRTVKNVIMGVFNPVKNDHRWININAVPQFRPGEEKPYRVYTTFEDITVRKAAEVEIKRLSERLRHYLATSPTIIYALKASDGDAEPLWVSDNVGRILGYTSEEVLPADWWMSHLYPDDRDQALANMEKLFQDDALVHEYRFLRKDGSYIWVNDESRLLRDDNHVPLEIVGSWIDISERKQAEERISHLNRVLRAIRDINQLIVQASDAEMLMRQVCEVLVKHRGYSGVLIILTDSSGVPTVFAQAGMDDALEKLSKVIKQGVLPPCCLGAKGQEDSYYVAKPNGICAPCPVAAATDRKDAMSIQLRHGDATYGYLVVSLDPVLQIDDEEKTLFEEMAGDVAFALHNIEQSKAVQRVESEREQLEVELRQSQKMEAVGRLAGGVAHDFNNMLSVILGYTQLLLEHTDQGDSLYKDLQEIQQAASRSADLVRQLLAFSRRQIVEPKVVDLNEVVEKQNKMLGRMIGENIEFTFLPGSELWPVRIDPSQVDQIMANLVVNARDAIAGVGKITVETANTTLDVEYGRRHANIIPGDYVMLTVSDTGIGMDAETLDRIFEPFFTTKPEGKGTGLGLSTVFGIVNQNNGIVHVYSEPGLGTTFRIYLPRLKDEVSVKAETKEKPTSLAGNETVIIVEDEETVLSLAEAILEKYGYRVITSRTPDEACRLVGTYQGEIDLLLTDVIMPTMNGKELSDRIQKLNPSIKTLFMSGYTADIIAHQTLLEDGINFIQKPFSVNSLVSKVREVLDK